MQKRILVASLTTSLLAALTVLPGIASADDAPAAAAAPAADAPKPDFTFAGNAGIFSDYRFRGFTQTAYKSAFQGGFDLSHVSGFYVGNWNSNVETSLYHGATLEMDFYGGYKFDAIGVSWDAGYYYYAYPSGNTGGTGQARNAEVYLGGTYGPFSAKLYDSTTNFFNLGDFTTVSTKGSTYLDLAGTFDLGSGYGLGAHVGFQNIKNGKKAGLASNNVTDYRLGVTKDLSGWSVGATLIATSKKDLFNTGISADDGGKTNIVLSASKSF